MQRPVNQDLRMQPMKTLDHRECKAHQHLSTLWGTWALTDETGGLLSASTGNA